MATSDDPMERSEWQVQELQTAIQEANAGKFASVEDLNQLLRKFGVMRANQAGA